jgi:hypothetical protein
MEAQAKPRKLLPTVTASGEGGLLGSGSGVGVEKGVAEGKEDEITPTKDTAAAAAAAAAATAAVVSASASASGGKSPSTRKGKDRKEDAMARHIEATALQMVDVVWETVVGRLAAGDDTSQQWMVMLIRETLHGKREGDEAQGQVRARRLESLAHCEKLVGCLVEMLLRCEEQDPALVQVLAAKANAGGGGGGSGGGSGGGGMDPRSLKDQLVAVVVTIAVFCEAHPPFSARHLGVLLPYLKGRRVGRR